MTELWRFYQEEGADDELFRLSEEHMQVLLDVIQEM